MLLSAISILTLNRAVSRDKPVSLKDPHPIQFDNLRTSTDDEELSELARLRSARELIAGRQQHLRGECSSE